MKIVKLLTIIIFYFTTTFIVAQQNITERITKNLSEYSTQNYPEKTYLHTDKSYYFSESTIWFTLYLVNGISHQKTEKSNLAYAELLNEKDSIISRKKLFIEDLSASGDFDLPKKISAGNYKIRAYTNYMRNKGVEYFFQKNITILSSEEKTSISNTIINDSIYENKNIFEPVVNFYPQGGYIVNNLLNRVALKIKNISFDELKFTGKLVDQNDNEIVNFSTLEFGLGEVSFIPTKGNSYYAIIETEEKDYKYKLPNAIDNGFILNTINNQNELFIDLNTTNLNGLLGATLIITERGKLIFEKTFDEYATKQILKLPLNNLNNSILQLTLLNAEAKPVCERLVFIQNENKEVDVNIIKQKDYYGNRRKVTLKVNTKDKLNNSVPSKLSMSVRDVYASPQKKYSENIKTWLLLNSDLKGKIENPNYFFTDFNNNFRKRNYLLDLTMLTHGWRRYTWQEIIENQKSKAEFDVEKGITIAGKTLQMKAPYGNISVPTRLTFNGKTVAQEPIQKSNLKGEFSYGPYVFFDSIPVFLEARLTNFKSKEDKDREVFIAPKENEDIALFYKDSSAINRKKSATEIAEYLKLKNYLAEIKANFAQFENVLDEIVLTTKLDDEEDLRESEMSDRTSYGSAFNRFDVSDERFNNGDALQLFYTIPGVTLINDSIIVNRFRNISPLILLDEAPIEVSDLRSIPASEISFIDVLTNGEALIFSSGGAVISIYSKEGYSYSAKSNVKRKPGIIDYKVAGFYTAKEFYSPDHINGIEEQTKADVRTTLYWNPNITITDNNDVEISFFTSDTDSKYVIEIEGISTSGIPLYKTTEIVVD